MEVVSGFISPWLASRKADRRPMMLVFIGVDGGFAGLALRLRQGLVWVTFRFRYRWFISLSLIVSMDHQHQPSSAASLIFCAGYRLYAGGFFTADCWFYPRL